MRTLSSVLFLATSSPATSPTTPTPPDGVTRGPAFHADLYYVDSPGPDLLITEKETYELIAGEHGMCCISRNLSRKPLYAVPERTWIRDKPHCAMKAKVMNADLLWWKAAGAAENSTMWAWYTPAGAPWRVMLPQRTRELSVIGDYAFTYFPYYDRPAGTNLSKLLASCKNAQRARTRMAADRVNPTSAVKKNGDLTCKHSLPGTWEPSWTRISGCKCMGVIENNPVLSPGRTTMLMTCPMVNPRVFWTWYTAGGEPVVFMETRPDKFVGTNLALADAYEWRPNASIDDHLLNPPGKCKTATAGTMPQYFFHSDSETREFSSQCYRCHLPKAPK